MKIITSGIAKKTISQNNDGLRSTFNDRRSRLVRGSIAMVASYSVSTNA